MSSSPFSCCVSPTDHPLPCAYTHPLPPPTLLGLLPIPSALQAAFTLKCPGPNPCSSLYFCLAPDWFLPHPKLMIPATANTDFELKVLELEVSARLARTGSPVIRVHLSSVSISDSSPMCRPCVSFICMRVFTFPDVYNTSHTFYNCFLNSFTREDSKLTQQEKALSNKTDKPSLVSGTYIVKEELIPTSCPLASTHTCHGTQLPHTYWFVTVQL